MLLFFILFFSSDKVSTALSKWTITASQRPFGITSCSLLEVGVFPTIVDSLAVEVMSVEVMWLRSFWDLWLKKLPDIHQKVPGSKALGQLHFSYKS